MFSGEFEHTIDDKGRLTIPAKFREALAEGMFVIRGLDGCLFVYPPAGWQELAQKVAALPITHKNARYFSRLVYSGSECKLDGQGRILLPAPLRQHAGIESEVVIVGVNSRLEIWSKERWQEVTAQLEKEGAAFAEQLGSLGI